jgi:hypothetical protein
MPTGDTKTLYVATAGRVGYGMVDFVGQDELFDDTPETSNVFPEAGSNLPAGLTRSQPIPVIPPHIDEHRIQSNGTSQALELNCNTSPPRSEPSATITMRQQSPDRYSEPVSVLHDGPRPQTGASVGVKDLDTSASPSELSRRHEGDRYDILVESSIERDSSEMDNRIVDVNTGHKALSPARQILTRLPQNSSILLLRRKADLLQYFVQKLGPWIGKYRNSVHLPKLIRSA